MDKYFIKKENNLEIAIKKRLDSSSNKPKLLNENEIKSVKGLFACPVWFSYYSVYSIERSGITDNLF